MKQRLVATAGRLAQEFGFNRAAGEILGSLYLTDGPASLDELEAELGWSKAAVSLAAAQLERLGLAHRVRKPGDRKRYYRSADDIGTALRDGMLKFTSARMAGLATGLNQAAAALATVKREPAARFLTARVNRLQDLNRQARRLLGNPLVRLFARLG